MKNSQMEAWSSDFGREYTDRSTFSLDGMDEHYVGLYGISRSEINTRFFDGLARDAKILEVGANVGTQLALLQRMGFMNLYGVELQSYAVSRSQELYDGLNIIQGTAFDVPFQDAYFDLVFTSGVLIHIAPENLPKAMDEVCRCSRRFVFGLEYYAESMQEIPYRGNERLMWKGDYRQLYLDRFADLGTVKTEQYKYVDSDNVDEAFLLEMRG